MGIEGLTQLIKLNSPDAIETMKIFINYQAKLLLLMQVYSCIKCCLSLENQISLILLSVRKIVSHITGCLQNYELFSSQYNTHLCI